MTLFDGKEGNNYEIRAVNTSDSDLDAFLFSLGCFKGEEVTIISILSGSMILAIRDGRYSIDKDLAKLITVK